MTDEQRTSRAVIEQKLREGTAVMDAGGETIGTAINYDLQGGYMDVSGGGLFADTTRVPLAAIGDTGASGLYLTDRKDDLLRQYGGGGAARPAPPAAATTETETTGAPVPARRPAQTAPQATSDDTIAVPVFEEQLVVGTQQEERGRVHLHKDVVQEQQTVGVALRHEEVTVERVAATGPASQADLQNAFQDQVFEVPVMGEEAVVGTQAHVVEEVRLHKDAIQEQQQVTGTVRKERVTVDETDATPGQGQGATTQGQTRTPRQT